MNEEKPGFWGSTFNKLKSALGRTKSALVDSIVGTDIPPEAMPAVENLAESKSGVPVPDPVAHTDGNLAVPAILERQAAAPFIIDDDYLETMEEKLIKADVGVGVAESLVSHLRSEGLSKRWTNHDVELFLRKEFQDMLARTASTALTISREKLTVVLIVGVNGTGKTTSIGKLCWKLKQEGHKVLLAAGDTFRAAAETQLEIWAERAGVDIVRLADGSDPGAVVFKAIEKAKQENYDILLIDTAGRLHNKANLMAELRKVRSVIDKHAAGTQLEALLVVDASIGQNGLQQAKVFSEFCPLTGVILTKLDGSAKGGIVFSIAREMNLPVKLVGLGEKIDDLRDFDPAMFVEALF